MLQTTVSWQFDYNSLIKWMSFWRYVQLHFSTYFITRNEEIMMCHFSFPLPCRWEGYGGLGGWDQSSRYLPLAWQTAGWEGGGRTYQPHGPVPYTQISGPGHTTGQVRGRSLSLSLPRSLLAFSHAKVYDLNVYCACVSCQDCRYWHMPFCYCCWDVWVSVVPPELFYWNFLKTSKTVFTVDDGTPDLAPETYWWNSFNEFILVFEDVEIFSYLLILVFFCEICH